jgi:hypothetical protein
MSYRIYRRNGNIIVQYLEGPDSSNLDIKAAAVIKLEEVEGHAYFLDAKFLKDVLRGGRRYNIFWSIQGALRTLLESAFELP